VTFLTRSGLQSHPQIDIFAKFAPSFAKLPKLQTPNAKLLDTSFRVFWQITQMQTSNAKPLEMLYEHKYHSYYTTLYMKSPSLDQ